MIRNIHHNHLFQHFPRAPEKKYFEYVANGSETKRTFGLHYQIKSQCRVLWSQLNYQEYIQ